MTDSQSWTTHDELVFLEGLGSHRTDLGKQAVPHQPIPRYDLLVRYQASLAARVEWGEIDREAVLQRVDATIAAYHPQEARAPERYEVSPKCTGGLSMSADAVRAAVKDLADSIDAEGLRRWEEGSK